jgi:hypothetical protein
MEVILERLLLELAAFAVQLAIIRLVNWLRERSLSPATPVSQAAAA